MFAGQMILVPPLPCTFDAESGSPRMLIVRGVRSAWHPRPVRILEHTSSFLERLPQPAHLANAFFVEHVEYSWRPGIVEDIGDHVR